MKIKKIKVFKKEKNLLKNLYKISKKKIKSNMKC